jgi:hypothetical protein
LSDLHDQPWLRKLANLLRRWGAIAAAGMVVLLLSQGLWWWQTWPVRQLVDLSPPVGATQ